MKTYNSANHAWFDTILNLKNANKSAPRGREIREIKSYSFCIKNPKKRIITNPIRRMSLPYAFAEIIWYLSGRNDLKTMYRYSKALKNFSDDGIMLNSAYGYRIFGHHEKIGFDQWDNVINILTNDKDSRQAIMQIYTANNKPTKDEVCTLNLQFLIRNNKLDLIANMRSNDIVWGFTYDVFAFTFIQEMIANQLGIEVGEYYHHAGSMHIYEKDYNLIDEVEKFEKELRHFEQYEEDFDLDGLTIESEELEKLILHEGLMWKGVFPTSLFKNKAVHKMFSILKDYCFYRGAKTFRKVNTNDIHDLMLFNYFNKGEVCKNLILEGCDGVGKTTYANEFKKQIIHFKKPNNKFSKLAYFVAICASGDKIFDRFYFSEIIYSEAFKRETYLTKEDIEILDGLCQKTNTKVEFLSRPFSEIVLKEDDAFRKGDIYLLTQKYEEYYDNNKERFGSDNDRFAQTRRI